MQTVDVNLKKYFLCILLQLTFVIYETHELHPLWMQFLIIYE